MTRYVKQISVWLIAVVLLAACSWSQLGYRFLDTLLRWQIDEYVSLYGPQGYFINERLKNFHAWHRSEQLPLYVNFLEQQKRLLSREQVTSPELERSYNQALQLLRQSWARLLPDLLDLSVQLDDAQIREVVAKAEADDKEYQQDTIQVSRERRLRERQQKMSKALENWIGSLSAEQQKRVQQWAMNLHDQPSLRLEQRQLVRQRLLTLAENRQNSPQFKQQAMQLLVQFERNWTPAYQQHSAKNRQLTLALLVDLHASLSSEQRARLMREIEKYRVDFARIKGR